MKSHVREENQVQAEAFRRIHGDEIRSIEHYAADFRRIINQHVHTTGQLPTADELIRIESQHEGRDITQD